jgi:hypothetical protein
MRFRMLEHLRPVIQKALRTGPAAARLVADAAVFESPDHHAQSTGVLSPNLHALGQTIHVLRMKTSWELDAQLLEPRCCLSDCPSRHPEKPSVIFRKPL